MDPNYKLQDPRIFFRSFYLLFSFDTITNRNLRWLGIRDKINKDKFLS